MMNKCLNIIVFYDNYNEVNEYLNQIVSISANNVDVAIVVNKDSYHKVEEIKKTFFNDNFFYYDFKNNVGYLNSLLQVVELIDINLYKYIILSNTDIIYDNEFYNKLLVKEYADNIGCIAPSVYSNNTNSFSNPHYINRISKKKIKRLIFIYKNVCLSNIYNFLAKIKASNKKKEEKESCFVYSPHGCFMIFTSNFIKKMIGERYGAFLYSEESYIGEYLLKYNFKCFFDRDLKIEHLENTVTSKLVTKNKIKYIEESLEYILNEFY